MRVVKFGLLAAALAAVGAFSVRTALATSPYTPINNDYAEGMEDDFDSYTPSDEDPLNDPGLDGQPPGAEVAGMDSTGLPYGSTGEDWSDIRVGGVGVIEEVPSGHAGIAAAPDSSAHVAIVQFEGGDGPFGRQNRDRFNGPTTGASPIGEYMMTTDMYAQGGFADGTANGIPDFWLTNAINENVTNGYMSESGMTGTMNATTTGWNIATTNGVPLGVIPVGTWFGYEMEPIPSVLNPGLVAFEHRLYSDGGTHLSLIGTAVVEDYVGGGLGGYAQLAGPRYTWFTFPDGNIGHVYVDNIGWAEGRVVVPEPGSMILAGFGAVGLVVAARRRRKA